MDLAALRVELNARGFDYLDPSGDNTRKDYFLNRGYHLLCEAYPWPFLRAEASGTAPLTISDLKQVTYVVNSTNDVELHGADERFVRDLDPDLSATGSPELWWLAGSDVLNVWPVDTTRTFTVIYYKVPDDLSDASDVPVVPSRYHYLIVDGAAVLAYRDSDNSDAALSAKADWQIEVDAMAESLLTRNYQDGEVMTGSGWYDGGG